MFLWSSVRICKVVMRGSRNWGVTVFRENMYYSQRACLYKNFHSSRWITKQRLCIRTNISACRSSHPRCCLHRIFRPRRSALSCIWLPCKWPPHKIRWARLMIQYSGDSYSQTGFSITGTKPSVSNPIGNPAFPGYTSSNGNNVRGSLHFFPNIR